MSDLVRAAVRPGYDTYVEPFLGCGAAFFEFAPFAQNRIAASTSSKLSLWVALRERPEEVLAALQTCEQRMLQAASLEPFLVRELRTWKRKPTPGRELFLRRHARVWGPKPTWFTSGRVINAFALRRAAALLQDVELLQASILELVETAGALLCEGTLVFCDLPVLTHWHAGPDWMAADAITAVRLAAQWANDGTQVVLRHPALPVMREVVSDYAPNAVVNESRGELVASFNGVT